MVYKIKKFVNFLILFSYIQKQTFNQPLFYMISFLPCFNIINAFKAAYLISGSNIRLNINYFKRRSV